MRPGKFFLRNAHRMGYVADLRATGALKQEIQDVDILILPATGWTVPRNRC